MPTDSMLSLTVGKLTLALCLQTACYHWQWADSHWHYAWRQHAITDSGQTHTGTMPTDSMLSLTVGRLTLALCLRTACYHWQWADSHWHYAWRQHAITDSGQTHTGTMPTDSMLSLTVGRLTLALCLETACYHWQWANSHWHYAYGQHAITDSGQTHTGTMPTDSMDGQTHTHYSDVIMSTVASQITSLMIVYSIVYSGGDQRKHQSSASLDFVQGICRWPVNSPHKRPVTRKMFPSNDVIMLALCLETAYSMII